MAEDLSAVVIAYGIAEVRTGSVFGTGGEKLVRFLKVWRRWRLHRCLGEALVFSGLIEMTYCRGEGLGWILSE